MGGKWREGGERRWGGEGLRRGGGGRGARGIRLPHGAFPHRQLFHFVTAQWWQVIRLVVSKVLSGLTPVPLPVECGFECALLHALARFWGCSIVNAVIGGYMSCSHMRSHVEITADVLPRGDDPVTNTQVRVRSRNPFVFHTITTAPVVNEYVFSPSPLYVPLVSHGRCTVCAHDIAKNSPDAAWHIRFSLQFLPRNPPIPVRMQSQ